MRNRLAWLAQWARGIFAAARRLRDTEDGVRTRRLGEIAQEARRRSQESSQAEPETRGRASDQRDDDDDEVPIELLGKSAGHDRDSWRRVQQNQVRVVESSNVYSYYFEPHPPGRAGILYVTFLHWEPGMKSEDRSGPGPTYAYHDFPTAKAKLFEAEAASSAGKAVWDFCRVRHSVSDHQHRYELVQSSGGYVPRKATRLGFAARSTYDAGMSPMERRQTLPNRSKLPPQRFRNGRPNRAEPNRGTPNRG